MSPRGVTVFISLLAVHSLTAMDHEQMMNMMQGYNNSMMTFPPLPPDFMKMATTLMAKCSKMGHPTPMMMEKLLNSSVVKDGMPPNPFLMLRTLLSSLPVPPGMTPPPLQPNDTMEVLPPEMDWYMTEKLQNCSGLPHLINIMRNSTDSTQCFMRAFVAPLSWTALVMNGSDIDSADFSLLLWGAKPFLQDMPPPILELPAQLQRPNLAVMMRTFSEVFSSLTAEQRAQISDWIKERVAQNYFNCSLNPSPSDKPNINPDRGYMEQQMPESNTEGEKGGKEEQTEKDEEGKKPKSNNQQEDKITEEKVEGEKGHPGPGPGCPPGMMWLKAEVMEMMGPFLTLLPTAEFQTVPKAELCQFFQAPQFPESFRGVRGVTPYLGRMLLGRLKKECLQDDKQVLLQQLSRLGSLACFYDDDATSLNASFSKTLLSQLGECENSGANTLTKQLVMTVVSSEKGDSLSPQTLQSLGSGVSALPLSQLDKLKTADVQETLSTFSKAKWIPAQAQTLASKLLREDEEVSGEKLVSLGSVVRGVASSLLQKAKAKALLGTEELETMSREMSSLQRTALLEGLRNGVNASALVRSISGPLLASLPLSTLEQADLQSVDELEGKNWTRAQSAFLVRKILGGTIQPKDIVKLNSAVQGVTCEMIDRVNKSDILEVAQTLTRSMRWLTVTQVCCSAKKLFSSLEQQRPGYFTNITDSELRAIPTPLLIHLPEKQILGLPDSVCSGFLAKMLEANLSTLPLSSRSRSALVERALACLKKNVSDLTPADITSLGPLVCELGPSRLSALAPDARNASLLALAKCQQIPRINRAAIFKLVKDVYGDPSSWSSSTMTVMGPLLLLNDSALSSLTYKPWLKSVLTDLRDSLPPPLSQPAPEEFRTQPDLSPLLKKLFFLTTTRAPATNVSRRRREALSMESPTLSLIEELGKGNVYWSPVQLANMSDEAFTEAVPILGGVRNYSIQQLEALRAKAIQVWGAAHSLSETQVRQLGCVCQGFNSAELQDLNITSPDTLELLSPCNWTHPQREAVWKGYAKRSLV
ncbi:hypothetical protein MATL_G00129310 [Megalops atlanticus]|uniref:Stereocilin LRR domain-containing protein n=1 Tax=Megalops atlanticus TaxID=7932 RepID=A0A9D3PVB6_MEGAT|nr:hypothetical protein MATL_G00129310 [Megalops atlanticus]